MKDRSRAILLIVIQCLLVSSIAGKYLYERVTCPRVWVKVAQYDPNLPMRGRYMALSPLVNVCSLPKDKNSQPEWAYANPKYQQWSWRVRTVVRDGKLVVEDARKIYPRSETQTVWLTSEHSCESVPLTPGVEFFIPDTAKQPFPDKPGQELWAEVTVPPVGPPRPIQLALSDHGQWKVLPLN